MSSRISPELAKQRAEQRGEMQKEEKELRRIARDVLTRGDGKLLMDILSSMYYEGNLDGADALQTSRLLGKRDVVVFLKNLLKDK